MATIMFLSAILIAASIKPEYVQTQAFAHFVILTAAFVWDVFGIVQKYKKR